MPIRSNLPAILILKARMSASSRLPESRWVRSYVNTLRKWDRKDPRRSTFCTVSLRGNIREWAFAACRHAPQFLQQVLRYQGPARKNERSRLDPEVHFAALLITGLWFFLLFSQSLTVLLCTSETLMASSKDVHYCPPEVSRYYCNNTKIRIIDVFFMYYLYYKGVFYFSAVFFCMYYCCIIIIIHK